MDKSERAKLYFGGLPTEMDVRRLRDAFTPKVGTGVTYEEIENVIGARYKSGRFDSVTSAWRRGLMREGFDTARYDGAVRFLTADEVHDECQGGLVRQRRSARRLCIRTEAIDPKALGGRHAKEHELLRLRARRIFDDTARTIKEITPPQTLRIAN